MFGGQGLKFVEQIWRSRAFLLGGFSSSSVINRNFFVGHFCSVEMKPSTSSLVCFSFI